MTFNIRKKSVSLCIFCHLESWICHIGFCKTAIFHVKKDIKRKTSGMSFVIRSRSKEGWWLQTTLDSRINVPLRLLYFLSFFSGLQPYSGLHRAYLSSIGMRYEWGYACSFCQIFQGLRLFKGVRLFQIADYTRTPTVAAHCTVGYFLFINFDFKK